MNHLIPTTTKTHKETATLINNCFKALIDLKGYQTQAYKKAAYLKADKLCMTNGMMLVEIELPYNTESAGTFVIPSKVGNDFWLIDQMQLEGFEYPETEPLFEAPREWTTIDLEKESLASAFCKVIHAMSTPELIGCLDFDLFKFLPKKALTVCSDATLRTADAASYPVVFSCTGFRAAIMPIKPTKA